MIPILNLFEAHLTVRDLDQSMNFYGGLLGLPLARVFPERKAAFYWLGSPGNSMLGIWEAGSSPQRLNLHVAFTVDLPQLLRVPEKLRRAGVTPLDFWQKPTDEPSVLAWMPAAAVYFLDPDGNLLEFISMLPDAARAELGIMSWSDWSNRELAPGAPPISLAEEINNNLEKAHAAAAEAHELRANRRSAPAQHANAPTKPRFLQAVCSGHGSYR